MSRLLGIESTLGAALRSLGEAEDWAAGWEPAPDIAAEVEAAREAITAAVAKLRGARQERRQRSPGGP